MILPFMLRLMPNIDAKPNTFSFTNQTGAVPQTDRYSNIVPITGLTVSAPVTVSAGLFRILGPDQSTVIYDWRSASAPISNGQCIQLYQQSPYAYSGTGSVTATIGGVSATWSVTNVAASSGSASYTTPGTYFLTVPYHNSMSFDSRGAGGGGGGAAGAQSSNPQPSGTAGSPGTYSQAYYAPNSGLLNVIGYPGQGGDGGVYGSVNVSNGSAGSASGGDAHYPGGGAAGGAGGWEHVIVFTPHQVDNYYYAGNGGAGGRSVRTVSRDILIPGQSLVIIVGSRGGPGSPGSFTWPYGDQHAAGYGSHGAVYVSWN